jgi:hypothetical protein
MKYKEQLNQIKWKEKREIILERDNNKCRCCNIDRNDIISLFRKAKLKTSQEILDEGFSIIISLDKKSVLLLKGMEKEAVPVLKRKNDIDIMKLKFGYKYGPKVEFVFPTIKRFAVPEDCDLSSEQDLNVHHKYYLNGKLAWEYKNEALISLCANCHQKEHKNNEIFVYAINGETLGKVEICNRCNGSGVLKEYNYYKGGVCFQCFGTGDNISEFIT